MKKQQENVLDVRPIDPREKHPTIFRWFEDLKPGESFVLLNDHDPSPLYYQMLSELGNVFDWEYTENGPEKWKIKLTKKGSGMGSETIGEIAARDLRKAEVFKKYGIDFCCGGKKTVKEACAEKDINLDAVEQELNMANEKPASGTLPYNDWELDFLCDYIVNTHHSYIRKNIPEISKYAEKVAEVHGEFHPELILVQQLVEEISAELMLHMHKEENILFPYIKELIQFRNNNSSIPESGFGSIENPIKMMEMEHENAGGGLDKINEITHHYTIPEDACASYSLLYRMLEEFESDLHIHIHLENNILFPKSIKLEKKLLYLPEKQV